MILTVEHFVRLISKEGKMQEKNYYLKHLPDDFRASIVVFLVAVPLCLGIALASGAPLFSGLVAGIVGGIVVSWLSGSPLSVAGPAAGLAVIVLSAIETLGSFSAFLLSVVIAGLLKIAMGYLRAGTIGAFFPSSVIKGMLAGIGLIRIIKQVPHALGYDVNFEGDESYMQEGAAASAQTFMDAFGAFLPQITLLGIISLVILIVWEFERVKRFRIVKLLPAPLIVVLLGIFATAFFETFVPQWRLESTHLVSIPEVGSFAELGNYMVWPDLSAWSNPQVYVIAATLAVIASIETLLSLEAVDKLDPLKRVAPTNRELKAQGVGNFISGLLGGLPVTSVIVRSSVNVYNGGKTKVSAFLHGIWLILSIVLLAPYLNMIPLASLAAILIFVGYKLANPSLFRNLYWQGWDQFLPFVVTIVAILLTDLLQGIAIGMATGLFFVIRNNFKEAICMKKEGNLYRIVLQKDVSFLNKALLRKLFSQIEEGSQVIIDGSKAQFIDHDILETIEDFIVTSKEKDIMVHKELFVKI